MNSFNHYSLGSVAAWMYRMMAGICEEAPGFQKIGIKPHFTNRLDHVSAEYHSQSGLIRSSWERHRDALALTVQIPANTTAHIYLKSAGVPRVQQGTAVSIKTDGDYTIYQAGSGVHVFELNSDVLS